MQRPKMALVVLLVVEGLGGLAFAALTVIIGGSITPGFIPWSFALAPAVFGAAILAVAYLVWKEATLGLYLAASAQILIGIAAVIGLVTSRSQELWVALAMGLVGLALVAATSREVHHADW